jgi:hypothetical protein
VFAVGVYAAVRRFVFIDGKSRRNASTAMSRRGGVRPRYDSSVEGKSGMDAQLGYLEAIDPEADADRRDVLRVSLLDYCRRATEAMMIVLDALVL